MQGVVPGAEAALIASGRASQARKRDFTRPAQVVAFKSSVLLRPRRNDDGRRVMASWRSKGESARTKSGQTDMGRERREKTKANVAGGLS